MLTMRALVDVVKFGAYLIQSGALLMTFFCRRPRSHDASRTELLCMLLMLGVFPCTSALASSLSPSTAGSTAPELLTAPEEKRAVETEVAAATCHTRGPPTGHSRHSEASGSFQLCHGGLLIEPRTPISLGGHAPPPLPHGRNILNLCWFGLVRDGSACVTHGSMYIHVSSMFFHVSSMCVHVFHAH